jgi:3-methyl-2-oxobutanoate hydroxymethyltransferase
MNIQIFSDKKSRNEKISMLTCYDYSFAQILNTSDIDALLIGDSVAMVQHGHSTTLPADVEMMAMHTKMVAQGAPNKLIIADMPFLSYRKSLSESMSAVQKLMAAGAHAIKLEGLSGHEDTIKHIVESGVPVMGHLGLTPQSIHQLGGFKVQGRTDDAREALMKSSIQLENLGCFSIVLECVPAAIAREISSKLKIPTIGIGAGPDTDGQILVVNDMLGMNLNFRPKFLRKFLDGAELIKSAANAFHKETMEQSYPAVSESYE